MSRGVEFAGQTGATLQDVGHSGIVCKDKIVSLGLWTRRNDCMYEKKERCYWSGKCGRPSGAQGGHNDEIKFPRRRQVLYKVLETKDQDFLETGPCL